MGNGIRGVAEDSFYGIRGRWEVYRREIGKLLVESSFLYFYIRGCREVKEMRISI